MAPTHEMIDSIFRDKVLRARAMSPEEKFQSAGRLFDEMCERMAAGLRRENPQAEETTIRELLRLRLQRLQRLRDADVRQ